MLSKEKKYPPIKKRSYIDQIFCWIEKGETQKVKEFFTIYPETASKLFAANNWTPCMYACRYGRKDLIEYFIINGFTQEGTSPYSLLHCAIFGNEPEIMKLLMDVFKKEATPLLYEQTPLKYVYKCENKNLLEILITRGAYFIYNDFLNNLYQKTVKSEDGVDIIKYMSKIRRYNGQIEEIEIAPNYIPKFIDKDKSLIQEFVKWCRVRGYLFSAYLGSKFQAQHKKATELNERSQALHFIALNNWRSLQEFIVGPKQVSNQQMINE